MWNISNLLAFLGLNAPIKQQPMHAKRRPTGAALRNPADPVQAARIEAAAAKREHKGRILGENADRAFMNNPAHTDGLRLPARFNPFHVAH